MFDLYRHNPSDENDLSQFSEVSLWVTHIAPRYGHGLYSNEARPYNVIGIIIRACVIAMAVRINEQEPLNELGPVLHISTLFHRICYEF